MSVVWGGGTRVSVCVCGWLTGWALSRMNGSVVLLSSCLSFFCYNNINNKNDRDDNNADSITTMNAQIGVDGVSMMSQAFYFAIFYFYDFEKNQLHASKCKNKNQIDYKYSSRLVFFYQRQQPAVKLFVVAVRRARNGVGQNVLFTEQTYTQ